MQVRINANQKTQRYRINYQRSWLYYYFIFLFATLFYIVPIVAQVDQAKVDKFFGYEREKSKDVLVSPILIIDPHGHSATILDIVFTRDSRYIVSASRDKTVRVWDVQKGKSVRTIRGEIGDGAEGKIFAMALSPDEHYLAVGGWMGPYTNYDLSDLGRIRLYNFQTGELVALLKSHRGGVVSLAFDTESKWLVSGGQDATIKLWNVRSNLLVRTLEGHNNQIYGVAFSPDGERIVSASLDNTLKLWETRDGSIIKTMKKHKDAVESVAYSPNGNFIASGGRDNKLIIWNGKNGQHIKTIKKKPFPTSVTFSPDSKYLLSGGYSTSACNVYTTSKWKCITTFKKHDDTVQATAFAPDGKSVATAGGNNHVIFIWNHLTGKVSKKLLGLGASVEAVGFGKDDNSIGFSNIFTNGFGLSTLKRAFDLDSFGLMDNIDHANYTHPVIEKNNRSLFCTGDYSVLRIYYHDFIDIKRTSSDGFYHNVFTFTSNGKQIISGGGSGKLYAYDLKGKKGTNFIGHKDEVWGVAISPDGDRLISGSGDQTIKIWNLKKRSSGIRGSRPPLKNQEPIATLFAASNGEWVIWTPEGYFATSENGANFIGYHINQGHENAAKYVSVDELYDQFYRPDLVDAKLKGRDISQYAQAVNIEKILRGGLAPKIEFITKSGRSDEKEIILKANITDAGGGIGDVTLYLNGIPISVEAGGRGMKRKSPSERTVSATVEFEKLISLRNGTNRISLMAYNSDNTIESTRPSIELIYKSAIVQKPNLHILAIAVNKYQDGDLRLNYSVDDATGIIDRLKQSAKPLFDDIFVYNIYDDEVRKDNIKSKFEEIGRNTTREDVFLMFVAGHGITNKSDGSYYFLPVDFRYTSEEAIVEQGVSMNDFKMYLSKVKALKSLLLLDTCNSGSFAEAISSRGMLEKTAINKLVRATGRATIVASSKDQVALEGYEGHGVFTFTILDALSGKSDYNKDRSISISELGMYIENVLPEITYKKWGYEQIPQKTLQGMDFPIITR